MATTQTSPTAPTRQRDRAMDAYRALAMFVVVAWHWIFTIPRWTETGPRVDNPISFVPELGYLTWVLQVMPLFFLVGGYVTLRSTRELAGVAERLAWVRRRTVRLLGPALPLLAALGCLYVAARVLDQPAVARAIFLTATPLWFLLSYLGVTALLPLVGGAARRWPVGHVVALVLWCVAWDAARFAGLVAGPVTWLSMVVIWLAVHQMGGLLDHVRTRRAAIGLLVVSFGALVLATHVGPYPTSMVGTTTDEISNMGPATAVLLALAGVQLALVSLTRDAVGRFADRHHQGVERLAALSMPVYVWHMVGFSVCVLAVVALGISMPEEPTVGWWLARPLWVFGPLAVAWPLIRRAAGAPAGGAAPR